MPNYEDGYLEICGCVFLSETVPPRDEMSAFIDTYHGRFGGDLICAVLRAAIQRFRTSRGYRATWASYREIRDEQLIAEPTIVHRQNFLAYGVKKMHATITRCGWQVGRKQTRRLTSKAGLRGIQCGKSVFTTITDPAAIHTADLINRQFKTPIPNRLWGADVGFVRTQSGFCYTVFVTDACTREIVRAGCLGDKICPQYD